MQGIGRYPSLNSYAITINSASNANIEKTAESRRKLKHSPQRAGSAAPRWPRVDRSGPRGPRFNSGAPRFFAVPAQCVAREPDRCKQLDRASFDETQRVIAMNSVQRSVSPVRRKSAPVRENAKHTRAHKDSAVQAWAHRVGNGRAHHQGLSRRSAASAPRFDSCTALAITSRSFGSTSSHRPIAAWASSGSSATIAPTENTSPRTRNARVTLTRTVVIT